MNDISQSRVPFHYSNLTSSDSDPNGPLPASVPLFPLFFRPRIPSTIPPPLLSITPRSHRHPPALPAVPRSRPRHRPELGPSSRLGRPVPSARFPARPGPDVNDPRTMDFWSRLISGRSLRPSLSSTDLAGQRFRRFQKLYKQIQVLP